MCYFGKMARRGFNTPEKGDRRCLLTGTPAGVIIFTVVISDSNYPIPNKPLTEG
ncbi:hypothetical protein hamaS1_30260 [Moorella sp. Hama-1]|nr:hypothetical protein hamaS1_30260 [Moorella sp. Hama-1]